MSRGQVEVVERSSGWWVVGEVGAIDGPFDTYEQAERASECSECGERLEGDGFCYICSAEAARFEEMAYGRPDRYTYPDEPRWLP